MQDRNDTGHTRGKAMMWLPMSASQWSTSHRNESPPFLNEQPSTTSALPPCSVPTCGIATARLLVVHTTIHLFIESVLRMSGREVTGGSGGTEPERKRRLLDAGGPVEDDETARQKMRRAQVFARVDGFLNAGFDPDNVADVKSLSLNDMSCHIRPMGYFAMKGDLPMMRWLYVNGADTRDEDVPKYFPMQLAASDGGIEACQWLFAHGAAEDIKRRTRENIGRSPLCIFGRFSFVPSNQRDLTLSYRKISRWLILNGALCKDDDSGNLDVEIMKRDLDLARNVFRFQERKLLLEWADDLHRARTSFLLFLYACLTRRSSSPVRILSGESGVLEIICDYTGIVCGREAKIIHQLTELLPDLNRELNHGEIGRIAEALQTSRN